MIVLNIIRDINDKKDLFLDGIYNILKDFLEKILREI